MFSCLKNNRSSRCAILLLTLLIVLYIGVKYRRKPKSTFHPPNEEVFRRSPPETAPSGDPPKVVCFIMTSPSNHQERARHVAATWGQEDEMKGMDKYGTRWSYDDSPHIIFVTSSPHPDFKRVTYTKYSSYEEIWGKVLDAFRKVNASQADWFMKADDDTFLIYPRLQRLLTRFDATEPIILGHNLIHTFKDGKETEYMSGGAGYILSSPAVRMLQDTRREECHYPGATSYEDVNMGTCMEALGIKSGDTRDPLGRPVFLPYPAETFFNPDMIYHPDISWMNTKSKYPIKFGLKHLSDRVVSFHQVRKPEVMYLLQYLTHDLRIQTPNKAPPVVHL